MCPFDFVDRAHRRGDYRVPAGSGRRGIGRRTSPPRSLGIRAFRDVAAGGLKARAVVRAGDGETTSSPLGGDVRFVVRGCDSGGALTALEVINPPGQGRPFTSTPPRTRRSTSSTASFAGPSARRCCRRAPAPRAPALLPGDGRASRADADHVCAGGHGGVLRAPLDHDRVRPRRVRAAAEENGMRVVGPPLAESHPVE
jgi:hypothetical protein